jgi:hypothetical protein
MQRQRELAALIPLALLFPLLLSDSSCLNGRSGVRGDSRPPRFNWKPEKEVEVKIKDDDEVEEKCPRIMYRILSLANQRLRA